MSRAINILFCILFGASIAFAQDFKKSIQDLQNGFKEVQNLHIIMEVKIYETHGAKEVYFQQKVEISKAGEAYFYQYGTTEMLQNKRYLLMVDHQLKEMVVQVQSSQTPQEMAPMFQMGIDSALAHFDEPQLMERKANMARYRLIPKSKTLDWMELSINEQDHVIRQMCYKYPTGEFVQIDFTVFDKSPVFEKGLFNESRYLAVQNKTFVAQGNYKTYLIKTIPQSNE